MVMVDFNEYEIPEEQQAHRDNGEVDQILPLSWFAIHIPWLFFSYLGS